MIPGCTKNTRAAVSRRISQALKRTKEDIFREVYLAKVGYIDATGIRQQNQKTLPVKVLEIVLGTLDSAEFNLIWGRHFP